MNHKLLFFCIILFVSAFAKAQSSVKTHEGVEIGGIKQWIGAKGNDDTKPLLLFLHGGPGFSSRTYSKKFVKALKKDFIVAQWDQRETGITKAWNTSKDSITLNLMHRDTEEVVDYLLRKFNKKKLFLVGYSWGGFLGFQFANEHPEMLHAYIAVSSMIYQNESERLTREFLISKAKESNNTVALSELTAIKCPAKTWKDMYALRKWTSFFVDGKSNDSRYSTTIFEKWANTWLPIFQNAAKVNYKTKASKLECPVYVFSSKKDFVAYYKLAEDFYNTLSAPIKELIWFPDAGHEIPSEQPKIFAKELIRISKSLQ